MKRLKELTSCYGVSGFEEAAGKVFYKMLSEFTSDIKTDALGNITGLIKSEKENAKKLLIEAHIDEIGLMITKIEDRGFLLFTPVGGTDVKILPGTEVTILGSKPVYGVIGANPPHLIKEGEGATVSLSDMAIDTGLSDIEKYVSVGDVAVYNTGFTPLSGDFCLARSFDDRAGLSVLIKTLEKIEKSDFDIYVSATVSEEAGLRGAKCVGYNVDPDYAISVDVTFGKSEGSADKSFELSKGPTICISPSLSMDLTKRLISLAEKKEIPFQKETEGGSTGTNAWAIANSGKNTKCALISVPIRYMHTTGEVLSLSDVDNAAKIIAEFIKEGEIDA